MRKLLQEYKAFIVRGNLLDLATAFILGVAFNQVVQALSNGVIMNFIAAVFGQPSFDSIRIGLGDGFIEIGMLLTAVVNFLVVAAVLFLILKAASKAQRHKEEPAEEAPAPSDEAVLLTDIRDLLRARQG